MLESSNIAIGSGENQRSGSVRRRRLDSVSSAVGGAGAAAILRSAFIARDLGGAFRDHTTPQSRGRLTPSRRVQIRGWSRSES
jgi:hypothetical protein